MNIHERYLNVFMNYSWMFLINKWDIHEIHELSTWISELNVHEIEVVQERPGTQVVQYWNT